MRSNAIEAHKQSLKLSRRQRSIIVGTLLGDGHLETQNHGRTYRLKIEHSLSQAFYVDWLCEELQDWIRTYPETKTKHVNGKNVQNYGFQTFSVGQLRFYGHNFYGPDGKKRVPSRIGKWLTPVALAVWFMDDGSAKSEQHKAIILNTHGFSRADVERLIRTLEATFDLEASIRRQSDGLQLMIAGKSAERFYLLVRPHILPDFEYKFGALVNILPKK